jgi:RNA polymerase sigma-70 factor (ECF subfamily)
MIGLQEWSAVGDTEGGRAAEAVLLRACQRGDRAALEQLLTPHQRPLLAFCHGMLGHTEDAEDAAQETLFRALRSLPRFRGEASFRTWLLRIAVNVCLNWKRGRRPTEPLDEASLVTSRDVSCPEAIVLRRLQMTDALNALRPHHRAVLLLKEQEGWSMTEIATALQWSVKRVDNELYRARRALVEWRRRNEGEGEER